MSAPAGGPFVAVLDYGIGNLRSAERALAAVGAQARLVSEPDQASGAHGVVLPGVGAFARCAEALRSSGLDKVALSAIDSGRPFLGICVGLQLLYSCSEEDAAAEGMAVFDGAVRRLPSGVKHPQMQWNVLSAVPGRHSEMLPGLERSSEPSWVYFVHSFVPDLGPETVATCDYGGSVVAAVERANVWGTQFHPEKSGSIGLDLLARFVSRCS